MSETHANYERNSVRQLKIHAVFVRDVLRRSRLDKKEKIKIRKEKYKTYSTVFADLAFVLKALPTKIYVIVSHMHSNYAVITVYSFNTSKCNNTGCTSETSKSRTNCWRTV